MKPLSREIAEMLKQRAWVKTALGPAFTLEELTRDIRAVIERRETVACSEFWCADASGLLLRCICCGKFKGSEEPHVEGCHLRRRLIDPAEDGG